MVPDTERYYLGISLELLTPIDVIAPHKLDDCRLFISNDFFTSDNRLNRAQRDLGATAAIFCEDNSVKVYGINAESQGFFAFSVTQDEIDALGQPATNTLLDSFPSPFGGDIRLYLLTTGELQLNAPGLPPESWKEYVFTWAGCTT
ncbi:MAG: hypothetical protein J0M33_11575 [Anaerolineae bacterium]|nr:hypothetical protein [Anaerolineae bacterium]